MRRFSRWRSRRPRCRCRRSRISPTHRLAPKISQLPGVGLVTLSGGQKPAVRIRANPTALASYGLNLEDVRDRGRGDQRQPGQRKLRRPAAELSDWRQRSAALERRLRAAGGRVPERRAGPPEERRDRPRFHRGRPPGRDDERDAGRHPQRAAPAGRQHHHGRRSHQDAAADADRDAAGRHQGRHSDRPHHYHPRVGERRGVLADADDCAGRRGDLPLPAHAVGDDHSERRGAALDRRHLRA